MYKMVKEMPGGPEWQACDVTLHDAPEEPQIFYYRDIIKCAEYLFQTPEFNGHMEFSPRTARDGDGNIIYHEMNTGEDWHEVQVCKHRVGCVCRLRHFARPHLTSGRPSSLSFLHQTKHTSQTTLATNQCILFTSHSVTSIKTSSKSVTQRHGSYWQSYQQVNFVGCTLERPKKKMRGCPEYYGNVSFISACELCWNRCVLTTMYIAPWSDLMPNCVSVSLFL